MTILWSLGVVLETAFAAAPGVVINEIVSSNVTGLPDEYEVDTSNCPVPDCEQWYQDLGESNLDGEYPDWIELYNAGDSTVNLMGYGLSDDPDRPFKWVFPDTLLFSGDYLVVFASGKDKQETYLHTNFRLARTGETILLTDPSGVMVDQVVTGEIPIDFSLGRNPAMNPVWAIFEEPTPAAANTTPVFPGFFDQVEASPAGGFHPNAVTVTLTATSPDTGIFYTTDGSEPTRGSISYQSPINVSETMVIRARSFQGEHVSSPVITQTYLIDESFTMPVISLSTHPDNLWDDDIGIYTPGPNARESQRIANYWNDWERPVHVEFFEPDGTPGFSIDAGIEIFGWGTRSNPQKSFAIHLRDQYGFPELNYPLFPDLPLNRFKAFVLRAGASDSTRNGTFFRDPFAVSLVKHKRIDTQAFRPAIVFLNGEYWGIENIREKMNEDYLASHHNIDKNNVDMISRYWRRTYPVVIEGDDVEYLAFEDFLESRDMADPGNYAYVKSVLDVDEFLNYTVSQIYFANYDWPGNNNKVWRERTPGGRWRSLMFDLDYTMNSNFSQNNADHDTLAHATLADGTGWPNPSWTTMIFRRLLLNEEFRNAFINRMADFMNTVFRSEVTIARLEAMRALYEPEMPAHIARWSGTGDVIASMFSWRNNIDRVESFLEDRTDNVRDHLRDYFNLDGWSDVRITVTPAGAGRVKINSIVTDSDVWTGTYFEDVPIQISPLPNPGFRFVGWSGAGSGNDAATFATFSPRTDRNITAMFESDNALLNTVVINEINYHSPDLTDSGDWVELYNAYHVAIDVSHWAFQDSEFGHSFELPEGTIMESGTYLIVGNDLDAFNLAFPDVSNIYGPFNFGLSNGGELLRLLDDQGALVDEVAYSDSAPWPVEPDGDGPTLALTNVEHDNSLPASWSASTPSPGASNVIQSPPRIPEIAAVELNQTGDLTFTVSIESGRSYVIQISTDLKTWVDHIPFAGEGNETTKSIMETPGEGTPRVFYRVKVVK